MSETLEYTTIYKFDELSNRAKERARDWFRETVFTDSCDWEYIYEDAATIADILGINLRQRPVKLMGGGTRYEPCIWFSGFSSQGDGACFEGSYSYAKGSAKAIRSHAPKDEELHRIADELAAVQKRHFYRLEVTVRQRGHGNASYNTEIEVFDREDNYRDIGDAEEDIKQLLRDFMDWIYHSLEKECEYQSSDENVDDAITCNEYTFDEDGRRED
jgi:hypothetical protein